MAPRNKLCGVCGKTTRDFPSPRLYEEHVKKHLDQTYSCDKCDIKFETKISLYNHQRHVHIPGIKCDCGCGKTFSRKQNLTRHLKETVTKRAKAEPQNKWLKQLMPSLQYFGRGTK